MGLIAAVQLLSVGAWGNQKGKNSIRLIKNSHGSILELYPGPPSPVHS